MAAVPPGVGPVAIGFQGFEYLSHQIVVDGLSGEHFLQQFMPAPNGDFKVLGQLVHSQVIGYDDGCANLAKSQNTAICGRRWGAFDGIGHHVLTYGVCRRSGDIAHVGIGDWQRGDELRLGHRIARKHALALDRLGANDFTAPVRVE